MIFLRMFQHLLPNGRAWRITADKALRQFFTGLAGVGEDIKDFIDGVFGDVFPDTTRELSAWETQFGLTDPGLTTQQRRDRLTAAWRALGGQSPHYIQNTLRDNGFDVYVHEWWAPGTEPPIGAHTCTTPRNPLLYLRREFTGALLMVDCGEALAQCGEAFAEAGNGIEPRGYPLVNRVTYTTADTIPLCGEALAQCGEELAECGGFLTFREVDRVYIVPRDMDTWRYFLYIGAETFGEIAQVDPKRRDEFEALCLKICPAQQWLGILVEYV